MPFVVGGVCGQGRDLFRETLPRAPHPGEQDLVDGSEGLVGHRGIAHEADQFLQKLVMAIGAEGGHDAGARCGHAAGEPPIDRGARGRAVDLLGK